MQLTEANYFSKENEWEYCGSTQYKDLTGMTGRVGCEARAMAKLKGEWQDTKTPALLIGSYVDAHFSGTLATFKAQHPEILKKDGSLKSDYVKANAMIQRCEKDEFFMKTLSGGTQEIQTAEFAGLKWKIKIDSYHPGVAIVDLKTTKSIRDTYWVKDLGRVSFVEYWSIPTQMAIYQKVNEIASGEKLPVLLACVSKEPVPDIEVIGIDQGCLDDVIISIEHNGRRIAQLKRGEVEPDRCNVCEYCRSTKVLKEPIHYTLLNESIQ